MNIVQILIGTIPKSLRPLIRQWERFATKNNHNYRAITALPEKYAQYGNRLGSEYLRMDILSSEPYTLYADWDTAPTKDFILSDKPTLFTQVKDSFWWYEYVDNCMYNGKDTELFKSARDFMKPKSGTIVFAVDNAMKLRFYDYLRTLPKEETKKISFKCWVGSIQDFLHIDRDAVSHLGYTMFGHAAIII